MKKVLSLAVGLLLLALCTLAVASYRTANRGPILYAAYFNATPPGAYATQRALLAESPGDADLSILRQAVDYHREERYDYALTAFRAYLESNPEPGGYAIDLLAATAAMASGEYAESAAYLEAMPREEASARAARAWYGALLQLRRDELSAAERTLRPLLELESAASFPVKELLDDLGD